MKINMLILALGVSLCCVPGTTMAQRSSSLGGGNANSWLGLLRKDVVKKEIELVADQEEQIEQLQGDIRQDMQDRMRDLRGLDPEERREKMLGFREGMEQRQIEFQQKIEAVLLPMQVKRLKELQIQSQSSRNGDGAVGVLFNSEVQKELGLDEEQKKKLEAKVEDVSKKLVEKIKKLRAEAEKEILSVLSSDQRGRLREMIGETFDFGVTRGFGGRDGRGLARGGRGSRADSKALREER